MVKKVKWEKFKKMQCPKCEYKWNTKSKLWLVSCPCCGNKVKNGTKQDL